MGYSPQHAVARSLKYLGVLLFLFVAANYLLAGNKSVATVEMNNIASGEARHVFLPYANDYVNHGAQYRFYYRYKPGFLASVFPYTLISTGYIHRIVVDGESRLKLAPNFGWALPRSLNLGPGEEHRVNIYLKAPAEGPLTLDMWRSMMFSPGIVFALLMTSFFCIAMSYGSNRRQWEDISAGFFMLVFFICSYIPVERAFIEYGHIHNPLGTLILMLLMLAAIAFTARKPQIGDKYGRLAALLQRVTAISPRYYVGGVSLLFIIAAASLQWWRLGAIPHVSDAHALYVHAKIITTGHLCGESHPLWDFFDLYTMINDGRYCSPYAPGYILLLALGMLLHVPWLVNPVVGGLTILPVYLLARDMAGRAAAYVAAALMLLSPFILYMSASFMTHATAMLCLAWFLYAYIGMMRTQQVRFAVLAGFTISCALFSRPQAVIPFTLPLIAHFLWVVCSNPMKFRRIIGYGAVGGLLPLGVLLAYILLVYGYSEKFLGFDVTKYLNQFLTIEYWQNMGENATRSLLQVRRLHYYLLGWPAVSLLPVLLLFLLQLAPRYSGVVLATAVGQVFGLLFNPFTSNIYGPRYLYESSAGLIVLTAICLVRLPAYLAARLRLQEMAARGVMLVMVIATTVTALFTHDYDRFIEYNGNYMEGSVAYIRYINRKVKPPALVFMKDFRDIKYTYFMQPPWPENPIIVAMDLGREKDRQLLEYFPGRNIYLMDGYTITPYKP